MATDNKKISVLSVDDDVRAVIRAKQELSKYTATIADARAEFERSNRSTDAAIASTNKITNAVLAAKKAYEDGTISVKEYNRVIAEAAKTPRQAPASQQRSTQDTVDRFGTFGSQVFGAFGASELGNAAGLVGDLASGIGVLNPAVIAGTVATGALTLAMRAAQEATTRVTEATKARVAAEREVNEFLRQATSEQTRTRLAELQSLLEFEQSEFERISNERDAFYRANLDAADPLARGFDRLRQSLGVAFGEVTAFDNSLTENAQRQSDLTTQIRELSFAVAGGEQAAQDMKAAEDELARARSSAIDDGLRAVEERVRFEQQLRDANEKATASLLETERNRREVLQAQIDSLGEVADADEKVQQELTRLNSELTSADLNIERLSNRLQGLSVLTGASSFLEKLVGGVGKGISNFLSPIQRDLEEQAAKAKRLEEKTRPILDEIDKLGQESLKKELEFAADRASIETAYAKEALRDARDFTRQRLKIETEFASSALSAVARRDAVTFKEAKDRREEELKDLKAQAGEQQTLRDEERREKLDALRREIQDFRQVNNTKRAELARQYQYEIQAEQARLTTQQSAAIARATIENAGANTVLGIARDFWNTQIGIARAAQTALAQSSSSSTPYTSNPDIVAARFAIEIGRSGR